MVKASQFCNTLNGRDAYRTIPSGHAAQTGIRIGCRLFVHTFFYFLSSI